MTDRIRWLMPLAAAAALAWAFPAAGQQPEGAPDPAPPPVIVQPVDPYADEPAPVPPPQPVVPVVAPPVLQPAPPGGDPLALPAPATVPGTPTAELPPPATQQALADPAWTHIWFLPTARTLREGDLYAHYVGYMGLFGVQYGINGDADIGVGLGWMTLQLAAKYALVQGDGLAFSLFSSIMVPIIKDMWPYNADGTRYFLLMSAGPLLSLWNDRAQLDIGFLVMPLLQWEGPEDNTTFDGDYPIMPWIAGSVRLGGIARLLLGVVDVAALGLEELICADRDSDGNCTRREQRGTYNMATALFGLRFHGRDWAMDIGLAFPLNTDWWDYTSWIAIPFATFGHLW
ncbi:MAG: hypothetical protein QME96_05355 [Myxococcota bacterium]|nr:hypothetical protein [Myxococcota bacterium]